MTEALEPAGPLPRHLAIIMDGNGRWAGHRAWARVRGHRAGAKAVRTVTRACARLGIAELTLYAFSEENWQRPEREVAILMRLLEQYLKRERAEIMDNRIRFRAIGRLERLPPAVRRGLEALTEVSRRNDGMILRLALSYGGRQEIVDAARTLAGLVAAGTLKCEDIDERRIAGALYDPEMGDPDLVIRTAGELRLSNFLLWQASYAEYFATDVLWPDFGEAELRQALAAYRSRVRRFGRTEGRAS